MKHCFVFSSKILILKTKVQGEIDDKDPPKIIQVAFIKRMDKDEKQESGKHKDPTKFHFPPFCEHHML